MTDMYERLVRNTEEPESSTGCWCWTGQKLPRGYGRLTVRRDGRHLKVFAHREMERCMRGVNEFDLDDDPLGPILIVERPALTYDETIDHLCVNSSCINPDHWDGTVSRAENTRLMRERRS